MQKTPINAFTVDVEDWFHLLEIDAVPPVERWGDLPERVERNTDVLLSTLQEADVRATWFLLGWIVERYPGLARKIARSGHEIASHGYGHDLVHTMGPHRFRADLERSVGVIEEVLGVRPIGYRAPGFSITADSLWALNALADAGITFDSSFFPTSRAHGGMPGSSRLPHEVELPDGRRLVEYPISVCSVLGKRLAYSGGGYLRVLPYPFIRSRIRRANARGEPVMVYIHPRDLDPAQPRLPMPLKRRFKSYVNLDTTLPKIRRLLQDFRFGTVSESLGPVLGRS